MIVEGLLTTQNSAERVNLAPMGPIVNGEFDSFQLRPFKGSTTFQNLMETRSAVFHVVDQVDLIAEAAIRRLTSLPPMECASHISGHVLLDCCRWFELTISHIDCSDERTVMEAVVVHSGERRPHFGFNRARHAVIEAAILATRVHLLPSDQIQATFATLESAVSKTGGDREAAAFQMLKQYVAAYAASEV